VILRHMEMNAPTTSFSEVKTAFERQYKCLALTCDDVGGYYDHSNIWSKGQYYDGAAPCVDPNNQGGLVKQNIPLSSTLFTVLALVLFLYTYKKWKRRKERLAKIDADNDLSDDSSSDGDMIYS
jgi:hypothetical protein